MKFARLIGCLVVLAAVADVECLVPIMYPSPSARATVFNPKTGELFPAKGAFPLFVCKTPETSSKAPFLTGACEEDLLIYTRESTVDVVANLLDDEGNVVDRVLEETPKIARTQGIIFSSRIKRDAGVIRFQVRVSKRNVAVPVFIDIEGERRNITIFYDRSSPSGRGQGFLARDTKEPRLNFQIQFSEDVVPFQNVTGCPVDVPDVSQGANLVEVFDSSLQCQQDLRAAPFDTAYTLTGTNNTEESYSTDDFTLKILAFPAVDVFARLEFKLERGSVMDYAGNTNGISVKIGQVYQPASNKTMSFVFNRTAAEFGRASSAAVVTTVAATTLTSVGTSVAASVTGSAAVGSAGTGGAATGAGGSTIGGVLDVLNMGQKIFLTSLMAANVPDNYAVYADELSWTMFDIRLPWEDGVDAAANQTSANQTDANQTDAASNETLAEPQGSEQQQQQQQEGGEVSGLGTMDKARGRNVQDLQDYLFNDAPYKSLKRVLFWVAILHGALFILHGLILLSLRCMNLPTPGMLYFPRLELYLGYWTMPAVATASAGLFHLGWEDVLLGMLILVGLPGMFIAFHIYILWHYFLSRDPADWEARVVISGHPHEDEEDADKSTSHLSSIPASPKSPQIDEPLMEDDSARQEESHASTKPNGASQQESWKDKKLRKVDAGGTSAKLAEEGSVVLPEGKHMCTCGEIMDRPLSSQELCGHHVQNQVRRFESVKEGEAQVSNGPGVSADDVRVDVVEAKMMEHEPAVSTVHSKKVEIETLQPVSSSRLSDTEGGKKPSRCWATMLRWVDVLLFWIWVGRPMRTVEWSSKNPESTMMSRYGPVFEENRALPLVKKRDASFAVDPDTGRVDRGLYEPSPERIPLFPDSSRLRRHHLQLFATTANCIKLILFAVIIGAEEDDENQGQLVSLVVISLISFLFLRLSRPHMLRLELGIALFAELADAATFALGLALVLGPSGRVSYRQAIGVGMLCLEGIALGLMILEKAWMGLAAIVEYGGLAWTWCTTPKSEKQEQLVDALVQYWTLDAHRLEKKYFDRWMLHALGKGLHNRELKESEKKWVYKKMGYSPWYWKFSGAFSSKWGSAFHMEVPDSKDDSAKV